MRDGMKMKKKAQNRKRNSRGVNELRAMIFIAFKCIIYWCHYCDTSKKFLLTDFSSLLNEINQSKRNEYEYEREMLLLPRHKYSKSSINNININSNANNEYAAIWEFVKCLKQ